MAHLFLSDDWIAAARDIRDEYRDRSRQIDHAVRVNLVVREVPFGPGTVDAHADTSSGQLEVDTGHLEPADVTLTLDYGTARSLLVEQDPEVVMQAFLTGRVRVDGDLARVIMLQVQLVGTADPVAIEVASRIRAITRADEDGGDAAP